MTMPKFKPGDKVIYISDDGRDGTYYTYIADSKEKFIGGRRRKLCLVQTRGGSKHLAEQCRLMKYANMTQQNIKEQVVNTEDKKSLKKLIKKILKQHWMPV